MKVALGSIIFLASMYLLRQVLVASGMATPTVAFLFLVASAGIPLGGLVLVEGALEQEANALRERIDALERRIAALEENGPSPH